MELILFGAPFHDLPPLRQVLNTHHFAKVRLHGIAITKDCTRMVCIGTLMMSGIRLEPSKESQAERQLIGLIPVGYAATQDLIIFHSLQSTKERN